MNSKINMLRSFGSSKTIVLALIVFSAFAGLACQSDNRTAVNNAAANLTPEKKIDYFQENLASLQRAGFDFIYAFRRTDGDVFSGEDKKFLKENSPPDTNQWRLTEDGKVVLAGSNYKFMPQHLDALRKRFVVVDYSPPPPDASANQNVNGESAHQNSNSANK